MKQSRILAKGCTVPMAIGGGIALSAALLTRLVTGSPLWLIHLGDVSGVLPPLWLTGLLWLVSFFAMGAAAGYVFVCPRGGGGREAYVWRGSTFFVLSAVLSLTWYALLFGKHYLLPSWGCLPLSAAFSVACGFSWWRICRIAGTTVWCFALWQIILCVFQLRVLLCL